MAIFLVRYTAPDIKPGICYGATHVPVHEGEFARVMPLIDSALPKSALVVTSALTRCRRLADFLAIGHNGREIILDGRLVERDLGRWTGKMWAEIPRDEARAFAADFLHHWPLPIATDDGPVQRGLGVAPRLVRASQCDDRRVAGATATAGHWPSPGCGDVGQLAFADGRQRALIIRPASPPAGSNNF